MQIVSAVLYALAEIRGARPRMLNLHFNATRGVYLSIH